MELGISVRINKPYAEEESVTHWSIDKHVVATTGGDINCASSCSTVVAVRRALRVYFLTSGWTCTNRALTSQSRNVINEIKVNLETDLICISQS